MSSIAPTKDMFVGMSADFCIAEDHQDQKASQTSSRLNLGVESLKPLDHGLYSYGENT
jgi:hypothetical protein